MNERVTDVDARLTDAIAKHGEVARRYGETRRLLAEAEAAAKTWENEAERRSRRYEQAAVRLVEATAFGVECQSALEFSRERLAEAERLLRSVADVGYEGNGTLFSDIDTFLRTADSEEPAHE